MDAANPDPLAYLAKRGVNQATAIHHLLGYALDDGQSLVSYLTEHAADLMLYAQEAGLLVVDRQGILRTHWNLCGAAWTAGATGNTQQSATCSAVPIGTIQASGDDGNAPANVLDYDLNTRWINQGNGSWITADLGSLKNVCTIGIACYQGDTCVTHFVVQGSSDNTRYVELLSSDSSGKGREIETYAIAPTTARYVHVVVLGNPHNDWASITELRINSNSGSTPSPTAAPTAVPAPTAPPSTPHRAPAPASGSQQRNWQSCQHPAAHGNT